MKRLTGAATLTALALIWGLSGCNLYSPFDKPSGDTQLLSAARACLDNGDYNCALNFYQQVSASKSDTVNSEEAFAVMFKDSAGMKQFISAFGKGDNVVSGFNNLSGFLALGVGTSGQSRRLDLFNSYQTNALAIVDPNLQSFTKFILATVLTAEILSENSANQGSFLMSDIALTPSSCTSAVCAVSPACGPPADNVWVQGSAVGSGNSPLDTATTAQMSGAPSAYMINAAVTTAITALGNLNTTQFSFGTLGTVAGPIGAALIAADAANLPCFRQALLAAGLGN